MNPPRAEGVELAVLVVVVGKGRTPTQIPAGGRTIAPAENVGIPEGRSIGAQAVGGELLFPLGNAAVLPDTDAVARRILREPPLALQPRLSRHTVTHLTRADGRRSSEPPAAAASRASAVRLASRANCSSGTGA
ncbi:hypothetical protein ACFZCF_29920 [Streptomyces sp. NPDC007945]|uniref:hypothetical protein n=1 Tax=Streptomyces sp. NPDC007945 TaxID=3364797 RepID=UPI0036E5D23C